MDSVKILAVVILTESRKINCGCFIACQVKNLRSQVSRSGICCVGDMFTTLGKHMDNVS